MTIDKALTWMKPGSPNPFLPLTGLCQYHFLAMGIMDRFDCQYLMATFVNVYIASFIRYSTFFCLNQVDGLGISSTSQFE